MRISLPTLGLVAALGGQFLALGPSAVLAADRQGVEQPRVRFDAGTSARDIPFRFELGHIILPVRVADSVAVDMLLDSGLGVNGAILLDPAIGAALDLRYTGEVPLGGGGPSDPTRAKLAPGVTLSLPGVSFPGQSLLVVTDPEPYRGYPGRGIIGKTVFDCVVEIDYEKALIHLYDVNSYHPPEGSTSFATTSTYGVPVMDASISTDGSTEIPLKLMVDTGAMQLLLFTWADRSIRPPADLMAGRERVLSKGFTGTVLGSTGRIARLQLGPHRLRQVVTAFPDSATWGTALLLGQQGMLGNDGLCRFFVTFDYAHNQIHLKPNAQLEKPFETDMSGMLWEPTADGSLAVIDVVPDSPAVAGGIEKGDVIVALDGGSVKELGWANVERLLMQDGVTVHLTVLRGAERLEKTIVTRRLI